MRAGVAGRPRTPHSIRHHLSGELYKGWGVGTPAFPQVMSQPATPGLRTGAPHAPMHLGVNDVKE